MFRWKFLMAMLCTLGSLWAPAARAQPQLPDITGAAQKGLVILGWTAQFDGVKSIAVQRSSDSVYNFTTIGYVRNLKKGPQGFIDGHPMPGKNYYRLYISFSSDLTWFSNRIRLNVDSAQILSAGVVPINDSLQKLVPRAIAGFAALSGDSSKAAAVGVITIPKLATAAPMIVPSTYVFTNPFTGHVNIELPEVPGRQYLIRFYNSSDQLVLQVPRVPESPLILDKRNFRTKGIFRFDVLRDKEMWEKGFISVY